MRNYDFCLVHCSQLEQNKTNGNEQQEETQEKKNRNPENAKKKIRNEIENDVDQWRLCSISKSNEE